MIHVLFLPKWYPYADDPFDGNFVENHAHAVQKFAQVSVLFVHSREKLDKGYQIESIENKGIQEIRVYYPKPKTAFAFFNRMLGFLRYQKAQKLAYKKLLETRGKPDLCHLHVLTRPAFLALRLKAKFGIPFLITEHWSGYLPSNGNYRGLLKKLLTERVVKKASLVHTVSSQLKEAMLAHGLNNRYAVIPNVVDTDLFQPQAKQNAICQIIFVGNLLERPKRILRIVESMKTLKSKGIPFHLSIYGEGADEKRAVKRTKELWLENEIQFCGTRNRKGIANAMAQADFLILFSEFENQPCVIAEAHASGIPIVVPDLGGIAELMRPELGLLVETGNQKEFESALLKMCETHGSYSSETIRSYAESHFSEDSIGSKFLELYQQIVDNSDEQ